MMESKRRKRVVGWREDGGGGDGELGRVAMAMELLSTAEDAWTHMTHLTLNPRRGLCDLSEAGAAKPKAALAHAPNAYRTPLDRHQRSHR
jgi:hypothetical protein